MAKTLTTTASWNGGMRIDAKAGNHLVIVDQPKGMGGQNEGANPMEYFLISLAGCIGTIGAIIANQERIKLNAINIDIEGDYDPAYLLGKTKEGRAGFTEIRTWVDIDADMTKEEKEAFLARIDARCPISDNMINNTNLLFEVK